jgi:hypothetical protein
MRGGSLIPFASQFARNLKKMNVTAPVRFITRYRASNLEVTHALVRFQLF